MVVDDVDAVDPEAVCFYHSEGNVAYAAAGIEDLCATGEGKGFGDLVFHCPEGARQREGPVCVMIPVAEMAGAAEDKTVADAGLEGVVVVL